jgi:pimeloyl-ACP methyl ester carboxylesterase
MIFALDAKLECRWVGGAQDDRPDIVMLHEGLGSVAMWKDFPERLAAAARTRVFAYSRQGHGASDPGPERHGVDYMDVEANQVLPVVLGQASAQRPILFGHSDGASIALIYAAMRPGDVSGLILEAPHAFVETRTIDSIAAIKDAFLTTHLDRRLARYHRDPTRMFWRWNRIWLNPAFRSWSIVERLPQIGCPILVIQGEDDEYGTRAQPEAIARAASGPTSIVMLPDCGHSPHRDQPDAVLQAARDFTQSIVAGA